MFYCFFSQRLHIHLRRTTHWTKIICRVLRHEAWAILMPTMSWSNGLFSTCLAFKCHTHLCYVQMFSKNIVFFFRVDSLLKLVSAFLVCRSMGNWAFLDGLSIQNVRSSSSALCPVVMIGRELHWLSFILDQIGSKLFINIDFH